MEEHHDRQNKRGTGWGWIYSSRDRRLILVKSRQIKRLKYIQLRKLFQKKAQTKNMEGVVENKSLYKNEACETRWSLRNPENCKTQESPPKNVLENQRNQKNTWSMGKISFPV
jgi:hypothetical protein